MSAEERPAPITIPTREGYIGKSVVRRETARLQAGRGVFTDDLKLPRMAHVAFFRSPHAHARIVASGSAPARDQSGDGARGSGLRGSSREEAKRHL